MLPADAIHPVAGIRAASPYRSPSFLKIKFL
jgi:hypothetical protein